MVKIGLRSQNWPNELETAVLYEHIISNFGGNRIDEIKLAFEMAIAGSLGVDANCFENFSCYYFSTIMNAYRKWSSEAIKFAGKPVIVNQKIFTQEELDNSAREDCERNYQLLRNGIAPKAYEINKRILIADGFMTEQESVMDFFNRMLLKGKRNLYVRENI